MLPSSGNRLTYTYKSIDLITKHTKQEQAGDEPGQAHIKLGLGFS